MLSSKELPIGQDWIIKYFKEMNYPIEDLGICHGLSYVWVHYELLQNSNKYDEIVYQLYNIQLSLIRALISRAKKHQVKVVRKAKYKALDLFRTQSLFFNRDEEKELNHITQKMIDEMMSKETADLLAIESFLESVALCNADFNSITTLDKDKMSSRQDGALTLKFVLSKKLEEAGGIATLRKFSGIYKKNELLKYFKSLRKTLLSNTSYNKPHAIILNYYDHTIAFSYELSSKQWKLFDSNYQPTCYIKNDADMASCVIRAFANKQGRITFATRLHTTGNDKECMNEMIDAWQNKMKNLHEITRERATRTDCSGVTWIMIATQEGDINLVNALLAYEYIDPMLAIGLDDQTPLSFAVTSDRAKLMNAFLSHRSFLKTVNMDNFLHSIVKRKNKKMIDTLLTNSTIDTDLIKLIGESMLFLAISFEDVSVIKMILDHDCVDPNAVNSIEETPLTIAAEEDDIELIKLLLTYRKTDPNFIGTENGKTPLMIAVINGNLKTVNYLLKARNTASGQGIKVDANAVTKNGETTALHLAVKFHDADMVQALLKNGNSDTTLKKAGSDLIEMANNKCCYDIARLIEHRIQILKTKERRMALSPFNAKVRQIKNDVLREKPATNWSNKRKYSAFFISNNRATLIRKSKTENRVKKQCLG